jgi:NAD(P)-dependent dehydrogenase (short-subunit alcohol dehydrogenase family)
MTEPARHHSLIDLTGRHAIVTGAGGGLGRAIALTLARAGASVSVLDVDEVTAQATVAAISEQGGRAACRVCDVTDRAQISAAFEAASESFGLFSILVNNAGINTHIPSLEVTPEVWDRTIAVNLTGYFACAQEFARRLTGVGAAGAVVNISSVGGQTALGRGNVSYDVTKAGVDQMTRDLAVVWAPRGIRVNAVAPCQVATEGLLQLGSRPSGEGRLLELFLRGIPLGRLAQPDDVAAAVAFLASDAAGMITGVVLPVDGGNLALNPGGTVGD